MAKDNKSDKWAKSLDEAGLLDEVEDSWELKSDPKPGSTITVRQKPSPDKEEPPKRDSNVPFAVPIDSEVPPPSKEPTASPQPETVPAPAEPEIDPEQIFPKTTARGFGTSGAPRRAHGENDDRGASSDVDSDLDSEDNPNLYEVPNGRQTQRSGARFSDGPVVKVRGQHISVAPDSHSSRETPSQGPIFDAPPETDARSKGERNSDPLGLVEGSVEPQDPVLEMWQRHEMGDYSGALRIAEGIMEDSPEHEEAIQCAEDSRKILLQMYESKIGSMERIPKVAVSTEEIIWRNMDPQTGFIVSQIDGMISFEDILDISGMPRYETCKILNDLLQDGIIE